MDWSLEFTPLLPTPILWALSAIAIALALFMIARRHPGAWLRAATLGTVILALANPALKQEEREKLRNVALVVVDESTSQRIAGRKERSAQIEKELLERLKKLPELDVQVVRTRSADATNRDGTRLFRDLNAALSSLPSDRIAAAFLLTDGQIHDIPNKASDLGFSAPVHVILNGAPDEFDRRIHIINAPKFGIVGSTSELTLRIEESGDRPDTASDITNLTIRREGQQDVARPVRIGETVTIPFAFPHAGNNLLELQLAAEQGELTDINNRLVVSAQGVRENLRVLLVSGEPHAGERTWRNLLKSDAAVDLVHFTILRPPEKQDGTPIHQLSLIAFPTRELFSEKLNDFDLIIFDRYQRRGVLPLLYLDNIARYVEEEGGAVLVAAGEDFAQPRSLFRTPLAQILPAVPTGRILQEPFRAKITETGNRHPVTRKLPGAGEARLPDAETSGAGEPDEPSQPTWGKWFRTIEADPARGSVIMSGAQEKPLLVLDRRGEGRVALMLSDHAWLWARGYDGGGPHTALLRRLSHWLTKHPDLEEEFLKAGVEGMALNVERRTMKETIPETVVTDPNGKASRIELNQTEPGLWTGTLTTDLPGLYRITSGDLSTLAHVGLANSKEMSKVVTSRTELDPFLKQTGAGAVFMVRAGQTTNANPAIESVPRLTVMRSAKIMHGSGWLGLKDQDAFLTKGVEITPLFTGILALAALLGLLALTWYREGRS